MKTAALWQSASTILSYIGVLLGFIVFLSIAIWLYGKKKYIESACAAYFAAQPVNDSFVMVPKAHSKEIRPTLQPLFTFTPLEVPTPDPNELEHTYAAQMAVFAISLILVIIMISGLLYAAYKKCRYRSSLIRAFFPCRPISRILRGTYRTDIFLEVTNISKGSTIWAHLKSVGVYPTQLRVIV